MLTDPENGELLKLKQDLEEVIDLTKDLIKTQLEEQKKSSYVSSYENEIEQALVCIKFAPIMICIIYWD